jgi:hypothetical protein
MRAQYGYHDPVTPRKEFESLRIDEILCVNPAPEPLGILQTQKYTLKDICPLVEKWVSPRLASDRAAEILDSINLNMPWWQLDESYGVKAQWILPENKFVRKEADLVDYVDWKFHIYDDVTRSP